MLVCPDRGRNSLGKVFFEIIGGITVTTTRGMFSLREAAYLESLPAVKHVTASRITYDESFKVECMRRYLRGESARKIFRESGLDPEMIGNKRIERCVSRWKNTDSIVIAAVEQDEQMAVKAFNEASEGNASGQIDSAKAQILMDSYSIADAAFAALSRDGKSHGMPDMRDLIICQQTQQIVLLQKQVDALQNCLVAMQEDGKAKTSPDSFGPDDDDANPMAA